MMSFFTSEHFLAIIPELGLLLLAGVLLTLSLLKNPKVNCCLGRITAIGSALVLVLAFFFSKPGEEVLFLWGGMLRLDYIGFLFRILFLAGVSLTAAFASTDETIKDRPEFYALLVFSAIGMSFMASAGDLIMLFLAIETASIPLYVLAGVKIRHEKSVEAGLKYFLFGAMASAIMLFGFSILYGMSGTTRIDGLKVLSEAVNVPLAGLLAGVLLVFAGFTFKISAVPFHFWAPDVYEGAPTPVAGYLSTASKAAGFAIIMRMVAILMGFEHTATLHLLIAVLATASMFLGNLVAIPQKNFTRLLAYSSIAQAGYILIGVATGSQFGYTAVIYYLMAYLVTNLALFAMIGWVERVSGTADLSAFAGLHKKSPILAFGILIGLLSLGGIPPFAGFFAKLLVFGAAVEEGMAWLAIVGIINSVIGLYYYLRILKLMYVDEPKGEFTPTSIPVLWTIGLGFALMAVLVLGVIFTPWFDFASLAALGLR
jgi:NADH-quinone oxidoreductase subunit N